MADNNVPNQSNFQSAQDFKINIESVYKTFIQVIDQVRSRVNIFGNQQILNNLDISSLLKIGSLIKPESSPQESRCHAFYRWIGFPVVSFDKQKLYNPGHDITNMTLGLAEKIAIANSVNDPSSTDNFNSISLYRERYTNDLLKQFANGQSIDAGALALLSGANIRSFASPFKDSDDPFDFSIKSQKYFIDIHSTVGEYHDIPLTEYVDAAGVKPTNTGPLNGQAHIIKPFMVDPRIDFSVSPSYNKIAVPFVKDNTYLRMSQDKSVRAPLLEKVITERYSNNNPKDTMGTSQQLINDYLKSIPSIKNASLINKVQSSELTLSEKTQFLYFLNVIQAMAIKLVSAQLLIKKAQSKYYWLPIPSTIGPEGGCGIHPVFLSKEIATNYTNLITDLDQEIINAQIVNTQNKYTIQGNTSATSTPNPIDLSLPGFTTTFGTDTSPALGDLSQKNLSKLTSERSKRLKLANDALKTIEIIMGEYSGLGLCDIIAIMGALYIMPKGDLLGFLDVDARERFKNRLGFVPMELSGLNDVSIEKSMTSFASNVKDFYNLMDKIYQDLRNNNGL